MKTELQASEALALAGVTDADWLPVHSTCSVAGHEMLGLVVSMTEIELEQLLVFPDESWAEYDTVVVPSG